MSTAAKFYLAYCLASCGYLCVAAIGGWPGLSFSSDNSPDHHNGSYGHTYSSGGYSGRTSGGFGGGGK